MERNEEEFAKYLQTFTTDVWGQLMKVSQNPGQVRRHSRQQADDGLARMVRSSQ
jgi:hypothetical protein